MERPPRGPDCACAECVGYCKRQPGSLATDDVPCLKAILGEEWGRKFVASPGAVVGRKVEGGMVLRRIPTITPRSDATGRCVFLDKNDRCEIHDVAPFGCSAFDPHMDNLEADRRSWWHLSGIMASPDYAHERSLLPEKDADFHDAMKAALSLMAGKEKANG